MSRFCIVLADQPYRRVFEELVEVLRWGLTQLGHEVDERVFPDVGARNIILAPHLLLASPEGEAWRPPEGTIVYNYEPDCSPLFARSLRLLAAPGVVPWDYAVRTTATLRSLGLEAVHVPYSFAPCLQKIPARERDLDVVFVGSRSPRRVAVLERLWVAGVRCTHLFGVFGPERDRLLARARVVLNVHYWDDAPNEDLRILHAAANGLAVVSEGPPDEERKADWAQWASYATLAEEVAAVARSNAWRAQAELGLLSLFQAPSMADVLREVLA